MCRPPVAQVMNLYTWRRGAGRHSSCLGSKNCWGVRQGKKKRVGFISGLEVKSLSPKPDGLKPKIERGKKIKKRRRGSEWNWISSRETYKCKFNSMVCVQMCVHIREGGRLFLGDRWIAISDSRWLLFLPLRGSPITSANKWAQRAFLLVLGKWSSGYA